MQCDAEDWCFKSTAIPIKRVPGLRDLARRSRRGGMTMARKRKQDSSGKQGVLPVMRADAAGIDIGATEIFVAVTCPIAPQNMCVRSQPSRRICTRWRVGSSRVEQRL